MTLTDVLGIMATAIVLSGFIPQIAKGYRTKKLDDISYFFMSFAISGMSLWAVYGFLKNDSIIIGANIIGIAFNAVLILMKKRYGKKSPHRKHISSVMAARAC